MKFIPFLTALFLTATVHGASLQTLSNPVPDGAIDTTGGNNDRTDWSTTTAFATDPDEANPTDFSSITVAHDSTNFYLREQLYRTDNGGFFSGKQIVLIDTDQSSATGYLGPAGSYAIGAEFLLEGVSLFAFAGGAAQTAFSWSFVGAVVFDDFPVNDHELTISRADLGSPESFDLIAINDYFGAGDLYPDSALGGGSGDFFTYTTIPEPSAAVLLAVFGVVAMRRRR